MDRHATDETFGDQEDVNDTNSDRSLHSITTQNPEIELTGDVVVQGSGDITIVGKPTGNEKDIKWTESVYFSFNFFKRLPQEKKALCLTCKETKSYSGSNTHNLKSHLENKHPDVFKLYEERKDYAEKKREELRQRKLRKRNSEGAGLSQQKICKDGNKMIKLNFPINKDLQQLWDRALIKFLAVKHISFSAVSGPEFEELLQILMTCNRKVSIRSRHTLSRSVEEEALVIINQICQIIEDNKKNGLKSVSYTFDLWTSISEESFISLTLHFIDK